MRGPNKPSEPQRIVSLAPGITEVLYALGVGERVAGVTRFCDWPPEAHQKALNVGGSLDLDDPHLLALQPDLVLAATFLSDRLSARLEDRDFALLNLDPTTIDEVMQCIVLIGQAVGASVMARVIVEDLRRRMAAIAADAQEGPAARPRVYVEEWHRPPTAAGHWVPELVTWAGGESGLSQTGRRSPQVTTEQVVDYDPQIIILAWNGYGVRARPADLRVRPGWEDVSALRDGQVHLVDDGWLMRPGPRLLLGLRQLAAIIRSWSHEPTTD